MTSTFYDRPMVVRMREIFGDPQKPVTFNQCQFDDQQEYLAKSAGKDWHEIDQSDYWHYLLDLRYVALDQGLFDYLFPAFLIRWWEGQLDRTGGPEAEGTIYSSIHGGEIFSTMMGEERRQKVFGWMTDAYIEGVDAWGGRLSVTYISEGPDNLHGPLHSFNALGQSVPVIGQILEELLKVSTSGRAQWWLVLASGLVWNENTCPFIPAWTATGGGGGVYVNESRASIYDQGYLTDNHLALISHLNPETLEGCLAQSEIQLAGTDLHEWSSETLAHVRANPARIKRRLQRFCDLMALPHLGGVLKSPLGEDP